MWIRRKDYEKLVDALEKERERNRVREEALLDRVLLHHGSRGIVPAPDDEVVASVPFEPIHSPAFRADWELEYAQVVFGCQSLEFLSPWQRQQIEQAWQANLNGTFEPDKVIPYQN